MRRYLFLGILVLTPVTARFTHAAEISEPVTRRIGKIGGWLLAPDQETLMLAETVKKAIVFIDTTSGNEVRRLPLDFEPGALALQKETLFVARNGSSIVYALDLKSGHEMRQFKLPGEPVCSLACHPAKGPLFAANLDEQVLLLNPESGEVKETKGRGMFLAVDPVNAEFLYTGMTRATDDEFLEVQRGPENTARIRFVTVREAAALRKYAVTNNGLRLLAGNPNAAIGGGGALSISPDGQKIALAAKGGWHPEREKSARQVIAVFSTEDLKTTLGQVETPTEPASLAFHPKLDLGVALSSASRLTFFKVQTLTKQSSLRLNALPSASDQTLLTFGGKGRTVVFAQGETLQIVPLGSDLEGQPSIPGGFLERNPRSKEEKAQRNPVEIKNQKSLWSFATAEAGAAFLSDRDYAITRLPKEMQGAALLLRTKEESMSAVIPIDRLTAREDCTLYAAIMWRYNGKEQVSALDFKKLAAAEWKEVNGTFTTSESGNEAWEWKVVAKPVAKGVVYVNLKVSPATIIFCFKADESKGRRQGAGERPAGETEGKEEKAQHNPVEIKNQKSLWSFATAEAGAEYLSDRDYAITKLPKEMQGSALLLRTAEESKSAGIAINQLMVLEEGKVYAALLGKDRVSALDRKRLAIDGWSEVKDPFTSNDADEPGDWTVLARAIDKGPLYLNLKVSPLRTIFFFKAEASKGRRQGAGERPAGETEGKEEKAQRNPVEIKNQKSLWSFATAEAGAAFLSDRDYAITRLPKEMQGAALLLRTKEESKSAVIPIDQLTAREDCTLYAAILWRYNGKEEVSALDFKRLAAAEWKEVNDAFTTTEPGNETWEWKVVAKPVAKGFVYVNLKVSAATTIFCFKADESKGRHHESEEQAIGEVRGKEDKPVRPLVDILDKKSLWSFDTAAIGTRYLSDRDYAITKLPKQMQGSALLVRTAAESTSGIIISRRLAVLENCTVYVAIMWRDNGKEQVSALDFKQLESAGWKEVNDTFETTEPGKETWEWKIVAKPVAAGALDLNLKTRAATVIIFFK
jgi:hypothetical protein